MHPSSACFIWAVNIVLLWKFVIPWEEFGDLENKVLISIVLLIFAALVLLVVYFLPSYLGNGGIGLLVGFAAAKVVKVFTEWEKLLRQEKEMNLKRADAERRKTEKEIDMFLKGKI
jgi:uncharacterized membrane protein YoaK (UPF0700 family)